MASQKTPCLLVAWFIISHGFLVNSQSLAGIINVYTPVLGFECDSTTLLVGSTTGFLPNDKVLIIQMQGAEVSTNPDNFYGDITSTGSCGHYEFNRVRSVSNGKIGLRFKLSRPYDVAGKVQLIFVPEYPNADISDVVRAKTWDGTTGGVIAFDVAETLTITGSINADKCGFRGGQVVDVNTSAYHETAYFYSNNPVLAAQKGEGVAIVLPDHTHGRGKNANAGGGGNAHNAGGGGGGSAGSGGLGGLEYYNVPNSPTNNTNGIGGEAIFPTTSFYASMGGGGGAGHTNDLVGSSGGNGGGIVFVIASKIVSSGGRITTNGENANILATNRNDGQGGGGGGGNIFCQTTEISGDLSFEAKGGNGANCIFHVASQIIGPGGGGGGGKIVLTNLAPSATFNISGGQNGVANQNLTNGAMPGSGGVVLEQSWWPDSYVPYGNKIEKRFEFCVGDTVLLNNVPYFENDTVRIVVTDNFGCDTIYEYIFQTNELSSQSFTFNICPGDSLEFANSIYKTPGVYIDTLKGGESCDTIALVTINWKQYHTQDQLINLCEGDHILIGGQAISSAGTVLDTIYSTNAGCDTIITYHINLNSPAPFLPPDTVICPGSSIVLNSPHPYTQWNHHTIQPSLEIQDPGLITAYFVDENGCPGRDTILIATCCSERNIYIPNVFSPNDDGLNDAFCVYTTEQCTAMEVQIYDRWGEWLFKSTTDPLECWDGYYRGKAMPSGVYVCVLLYYDQQTQQTATKTAAFTLVR